MRPDSHKQLPGTVPNNCLRPFFVFVSSSLEMSFFASILFVYHCRFLQCMESTSYVFSFRIMVFFDLVTTGWIFYIISLLCERNNILAARTKTLGV